MRTVTLLFLALVVAVLAVACAEPAEHTRLPPRNNRIPTDAEKVTPPTDLFPPILHSDDWEAPVPVAGLVNTAGGEDSPFVTPDGNTIYFFFTPDVNVPAEEQLHDGVTGVYVPDQIDGVWTEPQRVLLTDPGNLALDGCATVQSSVMWFCSAHAGYTGLHWFTARLVDGARTDWEVADFDPEYEVGELHLTASTRWASCT